MGGLRFCDVVIAILVAGRSAVSVVDPSQHVLVASLNSSRQESVSVVDRVSNGQGSLVSEPSIDTT